MGSVDRRASTEGALLLQRHDSVEGQEKGAYRMAEKNRLRVLRAERRLSQLALADRTWIHPTRIWRIENGYAAPKPREREVIASALAVAQRDIWPTAQTGTTPDGLLVRRQRAGCKSSGPATARR